MTDETFLPKLVNPGQWRFADRAATVITFNEDEVLVPLKEIELSRLIGVWRRRMTVLQDTGDYPEYEEDKRLLAVLNTAHFAVIDAKHAKRKHERST